MKFANLHLHSHFSLFDGAMSPEKIVEECVREGHSGCAITDHGSMAGVFQFWQRMTNAGLKPIIGCEFYVYNNHHTYHQTVLAQSWGGYQNLIRLNNLSNSPDRFYKKPRIRFTDLETHAEGLIILSGCMAAIIPRLLRLGHFSEAIRASEWFKRTFRGNFYIEIQPQPCMSTDLTDSLQALAHLLDVPTVASADSHHACFEHDVYRSIMQISRDAHKELLQLPFGTTRTVSSLPPQAVAMSHEILEYCEHIDLKPPRTYFPVVEDPLIQEMLAVARAKCPGEQLEYEISILSNLGFLPYFYVPYDLKKWCADRDIIWGPGRGSAAGSLFAYAIGITGIDPRKHGLIFERFLNPERASLPDIDTDIEDEQRPRVLEYLRQRWGSVCLISTYNRVGFSTAVRDVARALGCDFKTQQAIAEVLPKPVRGVYPPDEEYVQALQTSGIVNDSFVQTVINVKGKPKSQSVHAGGVVLIPPGSPMLPLGGSKAALDACQWEMRDIEAAGYIKYDFLGLKSCTLCGIMRRRFKKTPEPHKDWDADIANLLHSGKLFGVFQLGSPGIGKFASEFKPRNIEELAEVLALYRPGPLDAGIAQQVLNIRNGTQARSNTPLFIYQEQIMQYAVQHAGYSMAKADLLRKAIGKKDPAALARYEQDFDPKVWDSIKTFGLYGFNKSHAIAYAYTAFETAYWKAKHPAEFYAALLNIYADNNRKRIQTLISAKYEGIKLVLPQSVEKDWETVAGENQILLGCHLLKGLKTKPQRVTKRFTEALEYVNSGIWTKELQMLGTFLTAPSIPKGYGIVCDAEKKTSFNSGKTYYSLLLDTGSSFEEKFSYDKIELGELTPFTSDKYGSRFV